MDPNVSYQQTNSEDDDFEQNRSLKNVDSASTASQSSAHVHPINSTTPDSHQESDETSQQIDIRQSVQKGSFLPLMCLMARNEIDITNYIIDSNTGAKPIHYTGHFGNFKALKTMVEVFNIEPSQHLDYYNMTVAHYAARSGELKVLIYLARVS
jgi:hypothetical protein